MMAMARGRNELSRRSEQRIPTQRENFEDRASIFYTVYNGVKELDLVVVLKYLIAIAN